MGTYSNEHTFNLRKNPSHPFPQVNSVFHRVHFVHSKKGHSWDCFVHPFFSMRLMRGEEGCFRPTTRQEERERKDARASISFCGLSAVLCVSSSLLANIYINTDRGKNIASHCRHLKYKKWFHKRIWKVN